MIPRVHKEAFADTIGIERTLNSSFDPNDTWVCRKRNPWTLRRVPILDSVQLSSIVRMRCA